MVGGGRRDILFSGVATVWCLSSLMLPLNDPSETHWAIKKKKDIKAEAEVVGRRKISGRGTGEGNGV